MSSFQTKTKSFNFKCDPCGTGFYSVKTFSDHKKHEHGDTKPFKCETCGKGLRSLNGLSNHLRTHDGSRPFDCDGCDRKFRMKPTLERHKKYVHDKAPYVSRFKCEVCEKLFADGSNFKKHMTTNHTSLDGVRYNCEICDEGLNTKYELRIHERMHTTFKCGPCDKQFQTKQKLKRHFRLHTSLNGVRYKCEHCEEELNSKYELSIHVRNHTEFKCVTCKNFFTKRGLKWHKKVCNIPTTTEANKEIKSNSKVGDFQWIADYF